MTYEAFEARVSAYLDGELNPIERAAMDDKAAECERCGDLLRTMRALKERLAHLPQEQPSAGFNFELRSHLLMEETREQRASHRVRRVLLGSAVRKVSTLAAALLIGLGLVNFSRHADDPIPAGTAVVQEAEFKLLPGHLVPDNHLGALERLSEHSYSLDSRLYRNTRDSVLGRDTVQSSGARMPLWLINQDVQQVPVSF